MIEFLKAEQIKEMHDGSIVGFLVDDKPYVGKIKKSNQGVYLLQTRIAGEITCPEMMGMRSCWAVPWGQVEDYYMFQDEDILADLIQLDKDVAAYSCQIEKAMDAFNITAKRIGNKVISDSLELRRQIAKDALERAQKAADEAISEEGLAESLEKANKAADARYQKIIESWDTKIETKEVANG